MNTALADSFMAIFGFKRVASQKDNVITPVFERRCDYCQEIHEDGAVFCGICGDHHELGNVPFICQTGDGE